MLVSSDPVSRYCDWRVTDMHSTLPLCPGSVHFCTFRYWGRVTTNLWTCAPADYSWYAKAAALYLLHRGCVALMGLILPNARQACSCIAIVVAKAVVANPSRAPPKARWNHHTKPLRKWPVHSSTHHHVRLQDATTRSTTTNNSFNNSFTSPLLPVCQVGRCLL